MTDTNEIKLSNLTPAARKTVLEIARHSPRQAAAVAVLRAEYPRCRAIDVVTTHGSGASRRVYMSTWDGQCVDTESARHPMTLHAIEAISAHRQHVYEQIEREYAPLLAEIEREAARGQICKAGRVSAQCAA